MRYSEDGTIRTTVKKNEIEVSLKATVDAKLIASGKDPANYRMTHFEVNSNFEVTLKLKF